MEQSIKSAVKEEVKIVEKDINPTMSAVFEIPEGSAEPNPQQETAVKLAALMDVVAENRERAELAEQHLKASEQALRELMNALYLKKLVFTNRVGIRYSAARYASVRSTLDTKAFVRNLIADGVGTTVIENCKLRSMKTTQTAESLRFENLTEKAEKASAPKAS